MVVKKGYRYCPLCHGDYPGTHWHFQGVGMKGEMGKRQIKCPYCNTEFEHNGRIELQQCPKCGAELLGG